MEKNWPFSFWVNLCNNKCIRLSSEVNSRKIQLAVIIVAEYKLESFFVLLPLILGTDSLALMTILFLSILATVY
jgi:hypothetical protein